MSNSTSSYAATEDEQVKSVLQHHQFHHIDSIIVNSTSIDGVMVSAWDC
jgi:hypothetical protein